VSERAQPIVGHQVVRERLQSMAVRLPPSLIFAGPQGIGKKLVALEFARQATGDRRALDLSQPMAQTENIFFISPDGAQIKIEQAREAMHFLSLGREGRKLIMIFDQAHLMGPQAANALLKSIEEPPPGVHFIFIAPSPAMLLSTIRSRSQVVRFAPLLDEEVEQVLRQLNKDLNVEPWLLEMASGSVSAALELARGGEDSQDAVSAIVESLDAWLKACDPAVLSSERLQALSALRESLKERDHHSMAFRILNRKMAGAWRAHTGAEVRKGAVPKWLAQLDFEKLETVTDLAMDGEADLARNVDRQLLWEQLTSRIVAKTKDS
jgi:DNA polymerase-3 subunit delta'